MSVHQILDAARPPVTVPAGVQGVMGYIGGLADHVWTPDEWQPFSHLRQFPVWVAEAGSAELQGMGAVRAARALGWAPNEPGDATRVIIIDMETAVEPAWYKIMAGQVTAGGFVPVCYGSLSTVLGNAAADVLAAAWDGVRAIPPGQDIHGGQYLANVPYAGTRVDYSLFDDWLFNRGGVNARRQ